MTRFASSRSHFETLIARETVCVAPWLCPELRLRLITEACPLWRAGEKELETLGIPEPFWAFAWPGGQALARHVLDHPALVAGRSVLDFGAGSGLVGLAAARAGARVVLAADIDPVAVAAIRLNAADNGLELEATDENLVGVDRGWEVVLAGDVCYDPSFAARVLDWLEVLAARGALVLVGDPNRGQIGRATLREVAAYEAPADVDSDGRFLRRTGVLEVSRRPG